MADGSFDASLELSKFFFGIWKVVFFNTFVFQFDLVTDEEKAILTKHPEFSVPITCVWVRSEIRDRDLVGFDGKNLPAWLERIRVDRNFVCFLNIFLQKSCCF